MSSRRMARTASTRQVTNHKPNTTAADASGSPPNENKLPKINAKTPLIMPAVATTSNVPAMEGVMAAADPVGELEWYQEEIKRTRHDVQVRHPYPFHVAMVEFILRQRASGNVRHVNDETLADGPYDDQEEQADRARFSHRSRCSPHGGTILTAPNTGTASTPQGRPHENQTPAPDL
jgi:hypothetical protein